MIIRKLTLDDYEQFSEVSANSDGVDSAVEE